MTSMLCVQEPGGVVDHKHPELSEDVLRDSANHSIFTKYFPDDGTRPRFMSKRPFSTPNPQISNDNLDKRTLMAHSMKLQNWLSEKAVKIIQEKSDVESKPVKEMYRSVLDEEDQFVKGLTKMCHKHDYMNQRKREVLHKQWTDQVFEPVRSAVIEQMDGEPYDRYKCRKDQLHREYVEHCNRKGHVFRDDYDSTEYYPMGLHGNRPYVVAGLQANTAKLRDPTLLQERNANDEYKTMLRCTSGSVYRDKSLDTVRLPTLPLAPTGRHGTDSRTWINMPLTDIDSSERHASRKRMVGSNLKGEIDLGKWSLQTYDKSVGDSEMGIQKRKYCRRPPFTQPRVIGNRKRLPAAKESHDSKCLPLHAPYGVDLPLDHEPTEISSKISFHNIIVGLNDEQTGLAETMKTQYMANYVDHRDDRPFTNDDIQGYNIVV